MSFIKNRDIIISIVDTQKDNEIIDSVSLFVKSIKYDIKASGATFNGIKQADTLQWYSSLFDFDISGDSFVNPYVIPTLIKSDNNIYNLYNLYLNKFVEGENFEIGRYKVRLKINNCPIGDEQFEGVFNKFSFDEDDDRLGLIGYTIGITAKSITKKSVNDGIKGFLQDLFLRTVE